MRNALISIQLGLTWHPWDWTGPVGGVEGFRGKGGDWVVVVEGGGAGLVSADMGSMAARVSEGTARQCVPNLYWRPGEVSRTSAGGSNKPLGMEGRGLGRVGCVGRVHVTVSLKSDRALLKCTHIQLWLLISHAITILNVLKFKSKMLICYLSSIFFTLKTNLLFTLLPTALHSS